MKAQYQRCMVPYFLFVILHVWGLQLASSMYAIARHALRKKKRAAPGNLKADIIAMKRLNESKKKYKQYLKMQSQENSRRDLSLPRHKTSRRKIALKERNIGSKNVSENASFRKIQKLRRKERVFELSREDVQEQGVEFFNYSKRKGSDQLPVSQRQNDVFKVSARDFGNPETLIQMKLFEKEQGKEGGPKRQQEVIFEERTDDEEEAAETGETGETGEGAGPEPRESPETKNYEVNFGLFGRVGESGVVGLKERADLASGGVEAESKGGEVAEEEGADVDKVGAKIRDLDDFSNGNGEFLNIKTLENSEVVRNDNENFFNENNIAPPKFDFQQKMFTKTKRKKKLIFTKNDEECKAITTFKS